MYKINTIACFWALIAYITQSAIAQSYSIEYTYDRSKNSKFLQDRKYGLIDKNNSILITPIYEEVYDFYNGFARVVINDKVGFVNSKAEEVIPCIYDRDTQMITGAVIRYVMDGGTKIKSTVVTTDERREGFNEGIVCVIKNGKYGFVSKDNDVVIPFQFEGADNFYDGIAIVKMKNKYGAIDKAGFIVIPVIYDLLVLETGRELLYTRKNGECYLMDKNEKKIADCYE